MRWSWMDDSEHLRLIPNDLRHLDIREVKALKIVRTRQRYTKSTVDEQTKAYNVRSWSNPPVLVAPFRQPFHNICFISHKSQQPHHLLAACTDPPQHVALLCIFENKYQLIDAVDLIFNALDEWAKCVCDVVNKCIRNPIRCNIDIIF
jgi:hypothetical protein